MSLTKKALAAALGLAPSRVSDLARQGMPTDDIAAARRWRETHLRPYMKYTPPQPPASPDYLEGLDDGWAAAYEAIADFTERHGVERFGPTLVALSLAMTLQAAELIKLRQKIDDAWEVVEAEHDRLEGSSS